MPNILTPDTLTISGMTARREFILGTLSDGTVSKSEANNLLDELEEIDTWLAAQDLALGDYMDGAAFDRAEIKLQGRI